MTTNDLPARSPGTDRRRAALSTLSASLAFGVLPAVVIIGMFVVAMRGGPLALDFRNELYPQARELLAGHNPYPESIWPPVSTVVAMPFTTMPSREAGVVFVIAGLACMALALWLVGVRDWRVYGVVGLWPQVLADIRIAHLTPLLCLLAAATFRYRDRSLLAGAALGLAAGLKFLLWPLGVWLVATGRLRAAAMSLGIAAATLLLVLPFASLDEYVRTLRTVGAEFDQDSYTTYGLLTQLGVSSPTARTLTLAFGAALLLLTWQRRSFALSVATALALSPIVWFDFFALAAIPLAASRPRLSPIWLLPLVCWGLPSSGIATQPLQGVGRVLLVFAVVFVVAARGEKDGCPEALTLSPRPASAEM